jgi:hypothetical protein
LERDAHSRIFFTSQSQELRSKFLYAYVQREVQDSIISRFDKIEQALHTGVMQVLPLLAQGPCEVYHEGIGDSHKNNGSVEYVSIGDDRLEVDQVLEAASGISKCYSLSLEQIEQVTR